MSNCPDHCSECRCVHCGQKWLADRAAERIRKELADEWLLLLDEPEKASSTTTNIHHCLECHAPLKAGGPKCIGCLGWMVQSTSSVRTETTKATSPTVGQNLFELYKAACDIPWEPRKLRPRRFTVEPFVIRKTLY